MKITYVEVTEWAAIYCDDDLCDQTTDFTIHDIEAHTRGKEFALFCIDGHGKDALEDFIMENQGFPDSLVKVNELLKKKK